MSERCAEKVMDGWHFRHCSRKAIKDGYCKQHHPDSVKARREKADARYEEQRANSIYTKYGNALKRIAELEQQVRWQPIETAPRNIAVLVFIPNAEHYGAGIYRAIYVDMGTGKRWMSCAWASGRNLAPEAQPTHWRPLPPPPSENDNG